MDPCLVNMLMSILVTTHVPLLHASIATHLHDLDYEFHSHNCSAHLLQKCAYLETNLDTNLKFHF